MESVLKKIEQLTLQHDKLTPELVRSKDVKLGLRNADGTGVVVGFTTKGRIVGYDRVCVDEEKQVYKRVPAEGKLFYCGYDVEKIVERVEQDNRFAFDEICYLLLTGELPLKRDLDKFSEEIGKRRSLSRAERRIIMEEVHNDNQMYALHSVVSNMSRSDANPDSVDIKDVSRQCINLIAKATNIVATNYNAMRFSKGADLKLLRPRADMSTAENFLYMLHGEEPDPYEALLFDICLILHAEHGGGNNSTFTVRVVSSSGANTYMAIAAGIASLSGYLHGGANEHVMLMMRELKKHVHNWESDRSIKGYLTRIMEKKGGDGTGKIYGFGHAVYTLSDPRAIILRRHAQKMAERKGLLDEFHLYQRVEAIAAALLSERKGASISANVDFYSGFIYNLLGIPRELFTPIFAMARISGWAAHRIEQIIQGKVMRPAYLSVRNEERPYLSIDNR